MSVYVIGCVVTQGIQYIQVVNTVEQYNVIVLVLVFLFQLAAVSVTLPVAYENKFPAILGKCF